MVLSSNVLPLLTLMLCVRTVIMTNYQMIDVVNDRGKYNPIHPCVLYPLTSHFFIVKPGCTGVYIFFLFLL